MTIAHIPFSWMRDFYGDDLYWLVTVEGLPRGIFLLEADARKLFNSIDPEQADGCVSLRRLNGGWLCRPAAAQKDLPDEEAGTPLDSETVTRNPSN